MLMENIKNRHSAKDGIIRFFVSAKNGNDTNVGSREMPFASLHAAQNAVRNIVNTDLSSDIEIHVEEGEYRISNFSLTSEDSGNENRKISWISDGNAVLNGGITINPSDLTPIPEYARADFGENADRILFVELDKYGIGKKDYGDVASIGRFSSAKYYDHITTGTNVELFWNGERMRLAGYPNEGFLTLPKVLHKGKLGDTNDTPIYKVDDITAERIKKWKHPEKAWIYGFFHYDWANDSSPIKSIDTENGTVSPLFVPSQGVHGSEDIKTVAYGRVKGAQYRLYNVKEELDAPGEYYIDRENAILYLIPPETADSSDICLSITEDPIIRGDGVSNIIFDGFTLKCTRSDGIDFKGDSNVFRNMRILNVYGSGIRIAGSENLIENCTVTKTGKDGIIIDGGDRITLENGNNTVTNCYVTHFGQVEETYCAGIRMNGVGNTVSHNEIAYCPHFAIYYFGNDHLFEYNHIHDVTLQSTDAGAIYSGMDWSQQGTVFRYNLIENVGKEGFRANGIYFDDALSGQTAYGNILIGVKGFAFLSGGGMDVTIKDNVIVNCGIGIFFDDRMRAGLTGREGSSGAAKDQCMWEMLAKVPYNTSAKWIEKYPLLAKIRDDFDDIDDPSFPANPLRAQITNNTVVGCDKDAEIADSVYVYGNVCDNEFISGKLPYSPTSPFLGGKDTVTREIRRYAQIHGIDCDSIGIQK